MSAAVAEPPAVPVRTVRTVFAGLMLAMLLASLDQTIVSTALPTARGAAAHDRLVAARRERLAELLGDWRPEANDDLAAVISRLARDLVAEDVAARPAVTGAS